MPADTFCHNLASSHLKRKDQYVFSFFGYLVGYLPFIVEKKEASAPVAELNSADGNAEAEEIPFAALSSENENGENGENEANEGDGAEN